MGTISENKIFRIFKLSKNSITKAFFYIDLWTWRNQKDSDDLVCWKFTLKVRHFLMGQSKWKYFSKSDFVQNLLPVNSCPQDSTTEVMLILLCMYIIYYHMISTTVITNQYRFSGVDNLRISYTYDLAANSAILKIDLQFNFLFILFWKYTNSLVNATFGSGKKSC